MKEKVRSNIYLILAITAFLGFILVAFFCLMIHRAGIPEQRSKFMNRTIQTLTAEMRSSGKYPLELPDRLDKDFAVVYSTTKDGNSAFLVIPYLGRRYWIVLLTMDEVIVATTEDSNNIVSWDIESILSKDELQRR